MLILIRFYFNFIHSFSRRLLTFTVQVGLLKTHDVEKYRHKKLEWSAKYLAKIRIFHMLKGIISSRYAQITIYVRIFNVWTDSGVSI